MPYKIYFGKYYSPRNKSLSFSDSHCCQNTRKLVQSIWSKMSLI